jgi:hypothetical protein
VSTEANEAETTAQADIPAPEQVEQTAPSEEKPDLTPEQKAEAEEKADEEKRQASDRTKRRRRQRREAAIRREQEARIEAEKKAEYYRGLAEAGKQPESKEGGEPSQDEFETYEEYTRALIKWELAQANKEIEKPQKKEPAPETQETGPVSSEAFKSFTDAGTEKYGEDFDDMIQAAMNNEFAATEIMVEAMVEEDYGIDLAMHFYDNPEEAARIAKLSPRKQVQELNKLGAEVSKPKPEKKLSAAPEPITPEKDSSVPEVDTSKMTTEQYIKHRRKQLGMR